MSRTLRERLLAIGGYRLSVDSSEKESSDDNDTYVGGVSSRVVPKEEEKSSEDSAKYSNESYFAGESSPSENLEADPNSSPENSLNLLEKTRNWKQEQIKSAQYKLLKAYFHRMEGIPVSTNWYIKHGDDILLQPEQVEDFPCVCQLDEEYSITKDAFEGKLTITEKSPIKKSEISSETSSQSPEEHSIDCKIRRLSLLFSSRAKYFIGEEVDPDLFIYIPLPKGKFGEKVVVNYKYNVLQMSRKILLLKLLEGLRFKTETFESGMTAKEKSLFERRNQIRIEKYISLNSFLENLVKPYNNQRDSDYYDDDWNPEPTTHEVLKDKCRYLRLKGQYHKLKDQYRDLCKKSKWESFERRNVDLIEEVKSRGDYVSYDSFLEQKRTTTKTGLIPSEKVKELDEDSSEADDFYVGICYEQMIDENDYYDEYLKFLKKESNEVSRCNGAPACKETSGRVSEASQRKGKKRGNLEEELGSDKKRQATADQKEKEGSASR